MTETDMIVNVNTSREVLPVLPLDAKAWEVVNSVLEWMTENQSYHYAEACRALNVQRSMFYRHIKRPYVQGRLLSRMRQQDAAAMQIVEASWHRILHYQALMACGEQGSPRESTAAARFIGEQRKILEERLEATQGEIEGQSKASVILERFKERYGDGRPVTARRTTVTEEVEVR